MIRTIAITLLGVVGMLVLGTLAFLVVAWLLMRDDEIWLDHMERMHGLRDNE